MEALNKIPQALLTVLDNVGHYNQLRQAFPYAVWAEDSQAAAVWADNSLKGQALQGTIDYFTLQEGDPNILRIQQALGKAQIPFKLNSIQTETDRPGGTIIHYEWVWELWLDAV